MVKGDSKCYCIAAASVIAKVTRDRIMLEYGKKFPLYGFGQHKGYGTAAHMSAIHKHGPCEIHRWTFAPMKHTERGKQAVEALQKRKSEAAAAATAAKGKAAPARKNTKAAAIKKPVAKAVSKKDVVVKAAVKAESSVRRSSRTKN